MANDCESERKEWAPTDRAVMMEIGIARDCIDNFGKILSAHSIILSLLLTVNLAGFLQPPKGWLIHDPAGGGIPSMSTMYMGSASVRAFTVTNSLSLYSAVTGLLFYVYCSYCGFLSLSSISFPPEMVAGEYDEASHKLLHKVRACLLCVVMPSLRVRISLLFGFLTFSILFSGMAFVSAALAAVGHGFRVYYVALPGIVGCGFVLFFFVLVLMKHYHELRFEHRFRVFWKHILGVDDSDIPELDPVSRDVCWAFDPVALIPRSMEKDPGRPSKAGLIKDGGRSGGADDESVYFYHYKPSSH